MNDQAVENTDREIWREREGDAYADSIHVTQRGGIGMNCGGLVIVKPIRDWHTTALLLGHVMDAIRDVCGHDAAMEVALRARRVNMAREDGPLLKPATTAKAPEITTPEGAKQARENADWYRENLKPFA